MDTTPSSIAGIITAFATIITAAGGLALAIAVLLPILRSTKEIHTIVNQQRTDMKTLITSLRQYQAALTTTLEAHNIEVPQDQSLIVVEESDG